MTTTVPLLNWAGNLAYQATHLHRPASVDELRDLVAGSPRIRAIGSGHSFSPVADTTGELVRLDGLPPDISIDPVTSTVTVPAGTRYAELAVRLHTAGFALPNMASLPHISVAGCCATGTHGSGDTLRCLAAGVAGLTVVGADGSLRRLSRSDLDFPGSVVALGGLGIVTELTLEIEPAYEVAQRVRTDVPLDEISESFDAIFQAAYSVSVFTDWCGPANVWLKQRPDRPASGWAGGLPADRQMHPVPGVSPDLSTPQLGAPGPWYQRLPHFPPDLVPGAGAELQSEYYIPRGAARASLAAVREIGPMVASVLHISEIRTVRGDDLWLSPAYDRDSVTLHFTWKPDLDTVTPVITAVENRLRPLGARPHWGKLTAMPGANLAALYPRAGDFAALLAAHDPRGKFRNAFLASLFQHEA